MEDGVQGMLLGCMELPETFAADEAHLSLQVLRLGESIEVDM